MRPGGQLGPQLPGGRSYVIGGLHANGISVGVWIQWILFILAIRTAVQG